MASSYPQDTCRQHHLDSFTIRVSKSKSIEEMTEHVQLLICGFLTYYGLASGILSLIPRLRLASPRHPLISLARESTQKKKMKYVLVTGGVVRLSKGVTASSIGVVLKACGLRVTSIKIDPLLNTDAGTMSPFEHGEVFVLDDGGEVDLDLGNYERFLDVTLTIDNNITTGKIYQVVPHITDAIKSWIETVTAISVDGKEGPADVCVIELGGTVGRDNFYLVHVSLIPMLGVVGGQKTKPTQHSVRELRALGLTPHLLACRSAQSQNVHYAILKQLNLLSVALLICKSGPIGQKTVMVRIAMVGKYVGLTDSYLSFAKALLHASIVCPLRPSIDWIAASDLEDESAKLIPEAHSYAWETFKNAECVLVPGGFGDRGVKGMILAPKYARE
ncbi:CTP synthase-like protein [Drosera capensis]